MISTSQEKTTVTGLDPLIFMTFMGLDNEECKVALEILTSHAGVKVHRVPRLRDSSIELATLLIVSKGDYPSHILRVVPTDPEKRALDLDRRFKQHAHDKHDLLRAGRLVVLRPGAHYTPGFHAAISNLVPKPQKEKVVHYYHRHRGGRTPQSLVRELEARAHISL